MLKMITELDFLLSTEFLHVEINIYIESVALLMPLSLVEKNVILVVYLTKEKLAGLHCIGT